MAQVFSRKVYNAGISGVTTVYTDPNLNTLIASAEKFYLQLRASQTTVGSGTAQVRVTIQSSNDGVDWNDKSTIIGLSNLSTTAVSYWYGTDSGGAPGGSQHRLKIELLTATNPSTFLEIWLTGRTLD